MWGPTLYSSRTTVRRRCTEGLSGNTYSCCPTSRKISDEKTPYEKLPLDTSESLYRRKCNGGENRTGRKRGSQQKKERRSFHCGGPWREAPSGGGRGRAFRGRWVIVVEPTREGSPRCDW